MTSRTGRGILSAAILASALTLTACGSAEEADKEGGRGARGPAQVGFVTVQTTSVPVTVDLAGRVTAYQMSEVRPQVAGVIRRRFFTEGTIVRAGQTLYEIDPRVYRAAANEAQANLNSARANAEATRIRADRFRPLAEIEAVSAQDYTDAAAQANQAAAAVEQSRAQLETARVNLSFTRVPAPITGRIGRSLFTEGALVTVGQADPLTVIQRLDPIFVDIQQSSADLLALRRSLATGGVVPASAAVRLTLEDGSDYGQTGTVQFAEAMVDPATGTVTLRARFPNPQGILLPGMFVRAGFAQAIDQRAILVPQPALQRQPTGEASVFVVGPNNTAVRRQVVADRTQGGNWVVTRGLNPGDRVIVQGTANLRPGAQIRPVPASAPQRIAPPPAEGNGEGGAGSGNGAAAKAN
ncbi:membrane fusion protein (multidrug efflux system) [Sphingomonas jejuensis]|uniref:Membrane fusion protein (Multidrug efflux system) n=1 Tax=Sphingomonas jejuensis TaxID=904715 RepID=A0ABX0XPD0_9SPHN|nr:efflux RND transporter periplasmic adaptor subunit [Sphingomonas jejuensis]NJC35248.1 membrane fusion protein (multidrug efflux system) [Sphingomonas jejuensis]